VRLRSLVVLGIAIFTAALTGPGQTIGVSVFVDHFIEDLDLSRSQVSGAYLVGTLTGALLMPWVGKLVDQWGVRLAQIVIGIMFAIALVNMSLVSGLVWLAIGFAGIRFLGQGSLSLVSTVTVSLAFTARRGTALGIFTTATAGLMALAPIALAVIIGAVGWRTAWVIAAIVVLATVVPMAVFGLRSLPRGVRHEPPADDGVKAGRTRDFDRTEALRTRSFWIVAAVSASASMLVTALNFHQIDLMGDAGISETAAAALFLPQVIGSTVAGLTVGYAADRFGTRYLPAVSMALLIVAHLLAAVITPGLVVVAYSIMLGAMGGTVRVASSSLLPAWFGTTHLGAIQGALTFIMVASSSVGPVVLAITEASFDSYATASLVLAVIPMTALLFSLTPDRGRRSLEDPDLAVASS